MAILILAACTREPTAIEKRKAQALNEEGLALFRRNNFLAAQLKFQLAGEADRTNPEYPNNAGWCYLRGSRPGEAVGWFDRALAIRKAPLYFFNKGLALHDAGARKGAIEAFEAAVKMNPEYFDAWHRLGISRYAERNIDGAEQAWRRAATLKPFAETENNLALVHLARGQLDQAEERIGKALKLDPKYALAHFNLGVIAQRRNENARAAAHYAAAIRLAPEGYMAHYNRALVLERMGQKSEAARQLREFLRVCPVSLSGPRADAEKRLAKLKL